MEITARDLMWIVEYCCRVMKIALHMIFRPVRVIVGNIEFTNLKTEEFCPPKIMGAIASGGPLGSLPLFSLSSRDPLC
jgi:hypothetical protein